MIWMFFACNPISLEFSPENAGCINHDFDDPDQSEIALIEEDQDLLIRRTNVFRSSSAEFKPTYSVNGYKVSIREYWDGGSDDQFCWNPTVRIINHPNEFLEFWWYEGDSNISTNIIQYDPK